MNPVSSLFSGVFGALGSKNTNPQSNEAPPSSNSPLHPKK
jgi:hypothetical protein